MKKVPQKTAKRTAVSTQAPAAIQAIGTMPVESFEERNMRDLLGEIARLEDEIQHELMHMTEDVDNCGRVKTDGSSFEATVMWHSELSKAVLERMARVFMHVATIREHTRRYARAE